MAIPKKLSYFRGFCHFLSVFAAIFTGALVAQTAQAQNYTWRFWEIYSNPDGNIQYVVVYDQSGNTNNQNNLQGVQLASIHNSAEHAHDPGFVSIYTFPNNLPSTQTAGKKWLIGTQQFADLNIITPDFIVDNQFIPQLLGVLTLATGNNGSNIIDSVANYPLPDDGVSALFRDGSKGPNLATNFAGQTATVPGTPPAGAVAQAVEYYYADWNYYFITSFPSEIAALDGGAFNGNWKRTGQTFNVWTQGAAQTPPTCRFFSTAFDPKSSHFYTPFAAECASVRQNPSWQFESIAFYLQLTDANGNCAAGSVPLYRLYNNGQGGAPNHRYTTNLNTANQMAAAGWVFEGSGTPTVFACTAP